MAGEKEMPQGFFDTMYGAGQAVLDAAKKPLVRNSLKRKFRSAYDDARTRCIDEENKITELRSRFDSFDLSSTNGILERRRTIARCKELMEEIKAEYQVMFGSEMKIEED